MAINTWIIATDNRIENLLAAAKPLGGTVTVVAVGDAAAGVTGADRVLALPLADNQPVEAVAPAVAAAITAGANDLVLAADNASARVLAGFVAAKLGASVVAGATSFADNGGKVSVTRSGFGGIVVQTLTATGTLVCVLDGGKEVATGGAAESVSGETFAATVTGVVDSGEAPVELSSAKRIVALGRGFKNEADLEMARTLAAKLGAEIACSRPLAEGQGWIEKARYIGVTGQQVAPELYVAIGISGQLQHMVGCRDSKTIVVINNDDKAPIFSHADYAIAGDLYSVLPALNDAL